MPIRTFSGAVIVMTGGASGIGRAMAIELASRGAHLVLADRDLEGAQETAASLGPAQAHRVDVTEHEAVEALVAKVFEDHGRIDYFFNNAGIVIQGRTEQYDIEDWSRVLDVNIRGVVHGVHAVYPRMLEQGFGHIVNTASMAGLMPTPLMSSYGTSKHAVLGLSRALEVEGAKRGVRVSVLCPGFINTPILTGGKYGGVKDQVDEKKQAKLVQRLHAMEPEVFAKRTIDALAKNKFMIIEPPIWRAVATLQRFSPSLGRRLARKVYARTLAEMGRSQ